MFPYFVGPFRRGLLKFRFSFKNPFPAPEKNFFEESTERYKLSYFLKYDSYDEDLGIYENNDGTKGFIFECTPIGGADDEIRANLAALIDQIPESAVLTITLVSSSFVDPVIDKFGELKIKRKENKLVEKTVKETMDFLKKGVEGVDQIYGTPLKNFRLLYSLKVPQKELKHCNLSEIKIITKEALKGLYLSPREFRPKDFIEFLFLIFNQKHDYNLHYNPMVSISDPVILAENTVKIFPDHLMVGDTEWRCISPKSMSSEVDLHSTSLSLGGNRGSNDDGNQLNTHFLTTLVISKDAKLGAEIRKRGAFYQKQDFESSMLAGMIEGYRREHLDAVNDLEQGKSFFYTMSFTWVFNKNPNKVLQASQRAQRLAKVQGQTPQEEKNILILLFLSSLPMNFFGSKENIVKLDRFFVCKSLHAQALAPIVNDHPGSGDPHMLFLSRRGQLMSFDPYNSKASNHNWMICGSSGKGKSFATNDLVFSCYNSGSIVLIFDLGYSYYKQCQMLGGKFFDISFENKICINPYSFIPAGDSPDETEERYSQLNTVAEMVAAMVYSKTGAMVNEMEASLIRFAVNFVWDELGPDGDVNRIYDYLSQFPRYASDETKQICSDGNECLTNLKEMSRELAIKLTSWTKFGGNSRMDWWFNGKANINLKDADFTVVELEKIKREKEVFNVVSIAMIHALTSTLYTLPRHIRKMIVFEECGTILKGEGKIFKSVVEEAYRRGRKQRASTVTIWQSPNDIAPLGELGKVIVANSEFHLNLCSPDYRQAIKQGVLPYDEGYISLLESIQAQPPRYSEIGLRTPDGLHVGRLVVDDFRYWIDTSDGDDWGRVQDETKRQNGDLLAALEELKKQRSQQMKNYYGKID